MESDSKTSSFKVLIISGLLSSLSPQLVDANTPVSSEHTSVTGSRLNKPKNSPAVQVYSRQDILRSGESSVADFIRNLPINSFGSFRPQSGSTGQNNLTVALRGLGSSRTLVLIDGRRMPKSPTIASAADLNLLPMGAVHRIEILTESASAIYGTDAIGGVINIITRKEFQGAEIMLGAGQPSIPKSGGETEYGSVVFGSTSDHSSLVAGVSWNEREIIFERDVPWTKAGESVYGNSFTTITDGFDNLDWTSFIDACDFPESAFYTVINFNSPNGTRCAYDFSLVAAEDASIENKAFYVDAKHQLNEHWTLNANTLFSQTESFGRYAPVPDSSFFSIPLSVDSPNNPTNPNSPLFDPTLGLNPQAINWWHRFDTLGNRDTTVKSQLLDMKFSITGQLGTADLQAGIRHTDNRSADVGRNYLLRSAAQAFIEDGTYSLQNPYSVPESVLNAMRFTSYRDARYDQNELFTHITFDLFELNGGNTTMVVGAEHLEEKYFDLQDPQSLAGQVGGSAGSSAFAERDTSSLFFEANIPFFKQLSVNLAGRYDNYSDLGDDLTGKLSMQFQPFKQLSLYASYSSNHSTPNLNIMNNFNSSSQTSIRTFFPGCFEFPTSCSSNILETVQSNPFLESEKPNQVMFTVFYKPKSWIDLSLKYWDLEITNRLRTYSAQQVYDLEINGQIVPPGLGCIRTPSGNITECITGFANEGSLDISGLDLEVNFNYHLFNGSVSNHLVINHYLDLYENNNSNNNLIESPGYPEQRAAMYNNYTWKNWSLSYSINLVGSQSGEFGRSLPAPTWVTQDVQLAYAFDWQGSLTIGANNISDKFPPIRAGLIGNRDYDFNLYNGFGRIVYARYTQTF